MSFWYSAIFCRQKPILVCSADKENALRQITAQENAQQGPLVEKRATDQFAEKASKTGSQKISVPFLGFRGTNICIHGLLLIVPYFSIP